MLWLERRDTSTRWIPSRIEEGLSLLEHLFTLPPVQWFQFWTSSVLDLMWLVFHIILASITPGISFIGNFPFVVSVILVFQFNHSIVRFSVPYSAVHTFSVQIFIDVVPLEFA